MAKADIRHYVEFFFCGDHLFEDRTKVVERTEWNTARISLPKDSFGYRFLDTEVDESGNEIIWNISNMTYFGKEYTRESYLKEFPLGLELAEIIGNSIDGRVVKIRKGVWRSLRKGDIVVEPG